MKMKSIPCSSCDGHGYHSIITDMSISSERCKDCYGEGMQQVPVTRFDEVKQMDIEELAKFIAREVLNLSGGMFDTAWPAWVKYFNTIADDVTESVTNEKSITKKTSNCPFCKHSDAARVDVKNDTGWAVPHVRYKGVYHGTTELFICLNCGNVFTDVDRVLSTIGVAKDEKHE